VPKVTEKIKLLQSQLQVKILIVTSYVVPQEQTNRFETIFKDSFKKYVFKENKEKWNFQNYLFSRSCKIEINMTVRYTVWKLLMK
jgi:hypothetical protein